MTERIVQRWIGFLAVVSWYVAIISGGLLKYRESDMPNWGLGYLFLASTLVAIGLTYVSWGIWATSRTERTTKSLLAVSIVLLIAMILICVVAG